MKKFARPTEARFRDRRPSRLLWSSLAVVLLWLQAPSLFSAVQLRAQSSAASVRLTVEEVWSSDGFDMAGGLSHVAGLAEAAGGALWISDVAAGGPGRVLVHHGSTPPGTTRVVARTGDGPGEVLRPNRIAVAPNGDVAVYDSGRGGVEIYAPDGEPRGRVRFPVPVDWTKGFDALASGGLVLSGPVQGIDFAVHWFGPRGALRRSWGAPAAARDIQARMIGTGGAVHALDDGGFLYSQGAPHLVARWDGHALEGDGDGDRVAALSGLLEAPGDAVVVETVVDGVPWRSFNVTYPQSVAVFDVAGGLILNVVRMIDEGATSWQLVEPGPAADEDAVLLAETRVGVAYLPFSESPGGDFLATRMDPVTGNSVVVRLRATLERP